LPETFSGGRIAGMTMVKKTVTLDAEAVAGAMELGDGNLSAYVNEAVLRRVRRERLERLVEEDIRVRGPIPEEDVRATLESIDAVGRQ
jgi:hypothetical protein